MIFNSNACTQSVFTVRLHVMQRTVLLSQFCLSVCPSVCPSVRCVYCDKTKQRTANILIPHETAITLVFWHQQWLMGDAPFPLKSALKVTHPTSKNANFDRFPLITSQPYEIAKKFNYDEYKVDTGLPTNHRWSAYVTPKCPIRWLKERFFSLFEYKSTADRLRRWQLSSPVSVINIWWSAAMSISPTIEICI